MVTTSMESSNVTIGSSRTIGSVLDEVHRRFLEAKLFYGHGTDNAWDEACMLVLFVAKLPPNSGRECVDLPLQEEQLATIASLASRRIDDRVPLAYLIGRSWFMGVEFIADERALVPRSPFAELVANDFQPWWRPPAAPRVLDLCCGGGCIGISAALTSDTTEVVLSDIDQRALSLAQDNISLHGVDDRVTCLRSDLFSAFTDQRFDLILSNPPYVDAQDLAAMPAEYQAEPAIALGAGADGLDIARRILRDAHHFLTEEGVLFLELGNSWQALDRELSDYPLAWADFSEGGHGILVLEKNTLERVSAYYNAPLS